ncbi:extracellular solute-binding protein [Haloarchaeobius sp. DFWS5]|uniref:extracellular solute-binding protein n=1 Tax=Haloarchaeobius sp. DFWS5 TaxID=3446114 RepID=UPI003EBA78A5
MSTNRREMLKKVAAMGVLGGAAGCLGVSETDDSTSAADDSDGSDGNGGGDGTGTTSDGEEGLQVIEPENSGGTASMWHARKQAEKRIFQDQVKQFNSDYDQQVNLSEVAELSTKTETAIPAGKGPHSFDHAHDWAGKYYSNGWLVDQSDSLRLDLSEYFTEVAAKASQFDGATVGLPYAAETVGLVYNKELVDSPPETVSEMQSIMDEHHAPKDGMYGLSYPVNSYFMSGFVHAFGGYYYDAENDEVGLEKQETIEGLKFVKEQLAPYMPDSPKYGAQAEPFKQGRAPFAINGPWFLGGAKEAGVDVGVAPLPTPDGGEPSPYTGVKLLFFSKKMGKGKEANATASREFAEWYATDKDVLNTLVEEHSYIPVHKELASSDDLPANVQGYTEAVDQGIPMPTHPNMQDVWGPTDDAILKVYNGQASPEKALKEAAAKVRENWG